MLTYDVLQNRPKEFLAVTGLHREEFLLLLPVFSESYHADLLEKTATGHKRQRQAGAGAKGQLATLEDKLLFILTYQKTYPLQTLLGLHFGLGQPQANYWIHRLLPALQKALKQMGHAPQRDPEKVAECEGVSYELVIDGTERRRQRPQEASAQKDSYSGKKRPMSTRTC
jgi:hypothetical protein